VKAAIAVDERGARDKQTNKKSMPIIYISFVTDNIMNFYVRRNFK